MYMAENWQYPEAMDCDFDTVFPDEGDVEPDTAPVRVTINVAPTMQPNPNNQSAGLLDLSDEATLDKLSTGAFTRIRPEGQNVISVAFFQPAVLEKTHYSQKRNKTIRCLQPESDFCCTELGEPRDMIGVLAIQYAGASTKDGALKKGTDPDIRLGYVTVSKTALISMRKSLPEGSTVYSTDWKIWKKTAGFGYEYAVQRPVPAYKSLGLERQVEELVAPYKDGVKLRKRVAKPMSAMEVRLLLTGETPELDDDKRLGDIEEM
jgi:hypothetical protein